MEPRESPAAAGVFSQTTEKEMHPCVTPNTTNTMWERGGEVGAGASEMLEHSKAVQTSESIW